MKKLFSIALLICTGFTYAQQKKPNIVFIFSDDHAYQAISAYGNKLVQTPNIDRIAKDGALLENNFVGNSICGPSRATLLTGKYSHKNGYTANQRQFNINQFTFPDLLQQNGYQTAWIGKLHLGALPHGFDYLNVLAGAGGQGTYFNPDFVNKNNDTLGYKGYVTNLISDFFFDWVNNRDTSKPFFAVVGEKATHRSWQPDLQDLGAYDDIDFPLPDNFFDDYNTRLAAKDQDMTIDKTMRLKEDLKVGAKFGTDITEEDINQSLKDLQKVYPEARRFSPDFFRRGSLDSIQTKAYREYYGKITKEFEQKKLSGKDLVKWKFQRYLKDYYATAKSLDRNIGKILDYLDSTGLSKNTIVIYASDQGFYLGEHGWFDKRFMYEESFKTPFVIRYPGVIKPGTRINDLISNIDWAPTVLDIAGVKPNAEIQGRSFLPILKQQKQTDWRRDVYYHYYEYPQPHHVSPHFGIRTKDYVLIRFYKGVESWELFDLKNDPSELQNIYSDAKQKKTLEDLKNRLKKLILQYDDKDALEIFNKQL